MKIDAVTEVSVLRTQLESRPQSHHIEPSTPITDVDLASEPESLLAGPLPSDAEDNLRLSDLVIAPAPPSPTSSDASGQTTLLARAGFPSRTTSLTRPGTTPSPSRLLPPSARRQIVVPAPNFSPSRPALANRTSSTNTSYSTTATTRSKGMQMVSDMRSKVKNLEQRIHSRVPRMRNVSIRGGEGNPSNTRVMDESVIESPGWVIVTEGPTPVKARTKVAPPTSYRSSASTARPPSRLASLTSNSNSNSNLTASTNGRAGSSSRATSASSTYDSNGRPKTPTFLPMPVSSSSSGNLSSSIARQPSRRSSLGPTSSLAGTKGSQSTRPLSAPMPPRPPIPSMKAPPSKLGVGPPTGTGVRTASQVTRPKSNLGMSSSHALGTSRIGRPNTLAPPIATSVNGNGNGTTPDGRSRSGSVI